MTRIAGLSVGLMALAAVALGGCSQSRGAYGYAGNVGSSPIQQATPGYGNYHGWCRNHNVCDFHGGTVDAH